MNRNEFLSLAGMSALASAFIGLQPVRSLAGNNAELMDSKMNSGIFAKKKDRTLSGSIRVDARSVERYLFSCRKANGAFGPRNQEYTELAWNCPAVQSLHLLKVRIPRPEACLENGSHTMSRMRFTNLYQKTLLNHLFSVDHEDHLRKPWVLKQEYYERQPSFSMENGQAVYHDMESLWELVSAIKLAGGRIVNINEITRYISDLQNPNGSVYDNVMETSFAAMALHRMGVDMPHATRCADWIQSCMDEQGGFRWSPDDPSHSNKPDIWYTWAAVKVLDDFGVRPAHPDRVVNWINSLQNYDGGFGDRPGWPSRIDSTYHALAALQVLVGDARAGIQEKIVASPRSSGFQPEGYDFFQAHHKGSPGGTDMLEIIRKMGYDLIAVKAQDYDVSELRAYVEKKGYDLEVLSNPEVYEHIYQLHGRPVDHISNFIVPPEMSQEEQSRFKAIIDAGEQGLEWPEFTEQVIRPLLEMGTLFYPEWDHERVNSYRVYDDGLDGMPGYNAIHAAHRNGPDRIRLYPYRERWQGHLPFLADGDAHRPIQTPREYNNKMNFRNIFLAESSSLEDYLDASMNRRSVCVIRDPDVPSGLVYYGDEEAVDYMKKHRYRWQWWDD